MKTDSQTEAAVVTAYLSGKGADLIADEFRLNRHTVLAILIRNDIPRRHHKYDVDVNYFSSISTEEQSYWLGFLSADGCASPGGYLCSLFLAVRDESHIAQFRTAIGFTGPILDRHLKAPSGTVSHQRGVTITRKAFYENLVKQGVCPRKSWCLAPPSGNVPDDLLRHWWRGHFDGDGSVSKRSNRPDETNWQVSSLGTKAVMDGFAEFVRRHTNISTRVHRKVNVWKVLYGGIQHPQTVARLLYDGATVYLPRKKARVDELLATVPRRTRGLLVGGRFERTADVAARLNVRPNTIRARVKRFGFTLEEAVSTPGPTTITHNGETLSIQKWALRLNITEVAIRERLKKNEPVDQVLRPMTLPQTLTVNGTTSTIQEWAVKAGVSGSTIYRRLKSGESPEAAVRPSADRYHR